MSSVLLELFTSPGGHHGLELKDESLERLIVWMDTKTSFLHVGARGRLQKKVRFLPAFPDERR